MPTSRVTPPPQVGAQLVDGGAKSGGDVFAAFEDSSNKGKVGVVMCVCGGGGKVGVVMCGGVD